MCLFSKCTAMFCFGKKTKYTYAMITIVKMLINFVSEVSSILITDCYDVKKSFKCGLKK